MPSEAARPSFSWPSRRVVTAIIALWLLASVPGLIVLNFRQFRLGTFGEALSYLALALACSTIVPLRAMFARLSRGLSMVLVAFAVLVAFGQLGGGGRHIFPLVRFNVYTDEVAEDVSFTRLVGHSETGNRILVEGAEVFYSLQGGRFQSFHTSLLEASGLTRTDAVSSESPQVRDYERLLRSVLRQYNDDNDRRLAALSVEAYAGPDVPELANRRRLKSKTLITVYADGRYRVGASSTQEQRGR
jgi:hypothetical protein